MKASWRGYAVRAAVIAVIYILLNALALRVQAPALLRLVAFINGVILLPLILYYAIKTIGNLIAEKAVGKGLGLIGLALMDLVAPAAGLYIGFSNLASSIAQFVKPPTYLTPALTALYMLALGLMIRRFSKNDLGGAVSDAVSGVGVAVFIYGFAGLIYLASSPLAMPFEVLSLTVAATSLAMLGGLRNPQVLELKPLFNRVNAIIFIIALTLALSSIPSLASYSGYIDLAGLVAMLGLTGETAYRVYRAHSTSLEGIRERVYAEHEIQRDVKATQEDEVLQRALDDFIKYGNKEGLIMYATHMLTLCDKDLLEIRDALGELIKYRETLNTNTRWIWNPGKVEETMREEMSRRQAIARNIMGEITNCRNTKEQKPTPPTQR
ncbi:MAG: hypothetical protein RXQ94_08410 [Caldivirga sp.]